MNKEGGRDGDGKVQRMFNSLSMMVEPLIVGRAHGTLVMSGAVVLAHNQAMAASLAQCPAAISGQTPLCLGDAPAIARRGAASGVLRAPLSGREPKPARSSRCRTPIESPHSVAP